MSDACVHVTPNRNYICAQGPWYIDTPAGRKKAEADARLYTAAGRLLWTLRVVVDELEQYSDEHDGRYAIRPEMQRKAKHVIRLALEEGMEPEATK